MFQYICCPQQFNQSKEMAEAPARKNYLLTEVKSVELTKWHRTTRGSSIGMAWQCSKHTNTHTHTHTIVFCLFLCIIAGGSGLISFLIANKQSKLERNSTPHTHTHTHTHTHAYLLNKREGTIKGKICIEDGITKKGKDDLTLHLLKGNLFWGCQMEREGEPDIVSPVYNCLVLYTIHICIKIPYIFYAFPPFFSLFPSSPFLSLLAALHVWYIYTYMYVLT